MKNISFRIQQFIDYKGVSVRHFEKSIGASNGLIANAIKKDTNINSSWLSIIIDTYSEINAYWLLTGNGEMLNNSSYILNEPEAIYKKECNNCKVLEKEILALKNEIIALKDELLQLYRPQKQHKNAS